MDEFVIRRTGQPPLAFQGKFLANSEGQRQCNREWNRWHDLCLYQSKDGRYIVSIAYRSNWQGEIEHDYFGIAGDLAAAVELLRKYDPCATVQGYPEGEAYAEKQARLLADIRRRYLAQVTELFGDSNEFAEQLVY